MAAGDFWRILYEIKPFNGTRSFPTKTFDWAADLDDAKAELLKQKPLALIVNMTRFQDGEIVVKGEL